MEGHREPRTRKSVFLKPLRSPDVSVDEWSATRKLCARPVGIPTPHDFRLKCSPPPCPPEKSGVKFRIKAQSLSESNSAPSPERRVFRASGCAISSGRRLVAEQKSGGAREPLTRVRCIISSRY